MHMHMHMHMHITHRIRGIRRREDTQAHTKHTHEGALQHTYTCMHAHKYRCTNTHDPHMEGPHTDNTHKNTVNMYTHRRKIKKTSP
jgi:hypothetical protein